MNETRTHHQTTTTSTFFQTSSSDYEKEKNIARRENDVPHVIDKGDNFVICLTASHILSTVFDKKELSLCYTFCIVLLTKNSAASRTAHFPAKWLSISFPEVFIQSVTGKSQRPHAKCQSRMFELNFRS